jgi:hypothetical protein
VGARGGGGVVALPAATLARVAKEVALEKELDAAQRAADAEAEAEERRRRKEWRERVRRVVARQREARREEEAAARRPLEHAARQRLLGYPAADWELSRYAPAVVGRGGVGGRVMDELVGVRRMDGAELFSRSLDLAWMKEHAVWDPAVEQEQIVYRQRLPPWERAPASEFALAYGRARRCEREALAAWCRDWRPDQPRCAWEASLRRSGGVDADDDDDDEGGGDSGGAGRHAEGGGGGSGAALAAPSKKAPVVTNASLAEERRAQVSQSFQRVDWVAVPEALRARRVNRAPSSCCWHGAHAVGPRSAAAAEPNQRASVRSPPPPAVADRPPHPCMAHTVPLLTPGRGIGGTCHVISGAGLLPAHLEEAFAECCALRLGQRGHTQAHTPGFEPLLGNVTAHELGDCGADRPGHGVLSASSPAKLGVWVN